MIARIALLGLGVVIVAGVIFDLVRRSYKQREAVVADVAQISAEIFDEGMEEHIVPATDLPEQQVTPKLAPQNIITVSIVARDSNGFDGNELYHALHKADLHFGKNDIFYKYALPDACGEVLFFVVKAVEPGYFYIDKMRTEMIAGVSLVMIVDDLPDRQTAFDKFIGTAKQLAFVLNGELLDHKRNALTLTTIEHYKESMQVD